MENHCLERYNFNMGHPGSPARMTEKTKFDNTQRNNPQEQAEITKNRVNSPRTLKITELFVIDYIILK